MNKVDFLVALVMILIFIFVGYQMILSYVRSKGIDKINIFDEEEFMTDDYIDLEAVNKLMLTSDFKKWFDDGFTQFPNGIFIEKDTMNGYSAGQILELWVVYLQNNP